MTKTTTNLTNINFLTEEQYATSSKETDELWAVEYNLKSSDVTTALGYTPYNATNPNGYTSNTGTITGITMNGASKGTSGVVDLGTVITEHQDISNLATKTELTNGLATKQPTGDYATNTALTMGLSGKADNDLSNLTEAGESKFDGKADRDLSNCTRPYIIETYKNGASWYRVWSDGWIEQGGYLGHLGSSEYTNTYLKPFKDNSYTLLTSIWTSSTNTAAQAKGIGFVNKTATGFTDYGWDRCWYACGY